MQRASKLKITWAEYSVTALMVGIALVPVFNIFYIIATTGANNLSNDYAYVTPLIGSILDGGYDWGHFFSDAFYISHFQPIPLLIYLGNALLTGWNIYYELFLIAILSVVRLLLTYQVLTIPSAKRYRIGMLPVLAMLIFSVSQISTYEYGPSALPLGLVAFGFTLAVWGLVRFSGQNLGIIIMVVGGLIAAWTAAAGVFTWPVFLVGMLLLGYRKGRHYIAWLGCAIAINSPYIYFLIIDKKPGTNAYLQSIFNPRLIANLVGRPFANGIGTTTEYIPMGEAAGWIGMMLGVAGMFFVFIKWKKLLKLVAPGLMFMLFGLLTAWQISLFRVLIAPWYTGNVMPFWVGLVGLAYLIFTSIHQVKDDYIPMWMKVKTLEFNYIAMVLIILTGFYLNTNLSYQDKTFYLASRRPVSAACLRNYEWAPTYCERYIFQWSVNRVFVDDFARPLQDQNLNIFARNQRWSMQGDVVLGNVYSPEAPYTMGVKWVDGLSEIPVSYTSYKRLNLAISPQNTAVWEVNLPENLQYAELVSAINFGQDEIENFKGGNATFEIYVSVIGQSEQRIYSRVLETSQRNWENIRLPLTLYKGEEIILRFAVSSEFSRLLTLFQYPNIKLIIQPGSGSELKMDIRPINTDLSPEKPQPQPNDYVIKLNEAQLSGMVPYSGDTMSWVVQNDPHITYSIQPPIDLADYGWFSFNMRASSDIPSQAAEIFFYFTSQEQPVYAVIPLLRDNEMHTYTYPLRMLEVTGKIAVIRFDPVIMPSNNGQNLISIEDMRFIHIP